jgi:hypothetical protein
LLKLWESRNREAISKGVLCPFFYSFLARQSCSRFAFLSALLAHWFAAHFDPMNVVQQPIEHVVQHVGKRPFNWVDWLIVTAQAF